MVLPNPSGARFDSVSATVLDGLLYVISRSKDSTSRNTLWFGTLSSSGAWSGWRQAILSGVPLSSEDFVPGMTAGPEGKLYVFSRAPALDPRYGQLVLHTYDPGTDSWARLSDLLWDWDSECLVGGRPGALFRPHVTAGGAPLASGNGALWVWYTVQGPGCGHSSDFNTFFRMSEGELNATTQSFDMGMWRYTPLSNATACHVDEAPGGAVVLVDHPSSVAALMTQVGDTDCADQVFHVPYADGHAPIELGDFDDHSAIRDNLCTSVNIDQACKCANFNAACMTIPTGEYECDDGNEDTP